MRKLSKLLVLIVSVLAGYPATSSQAEESRGEQVVLLHGLARSSEHMAELETYLEGKGYTVYNLDYPSTDFKLDKLAADVARQLREKVRADQTLHFVGYSMGGLVVRAVLNKYRPDNLGRVVQLASPNHGSEVVDLLKDNWLFGKIFGPAGGQLVTVDAELEDLLGGVTYELGVLAGTFSIDPVSSSLIPGDDDGKVSVLSTKVKGMKDHLTIHASHTFFPQNEQVHLQTYNFLRFGAFRR